jgi:hypothetical protein
VHFPQEGTLGLRNHRFLVRTSGNEAASFRDHHIRAGSNQSKTLFSVRAGTIDEIVYAPTHRMAWPRHRDDSVAGRPNDDVMRP